MHLSILPISLLYIYYIPIGCRRELLDSRVMIYYDYRIYTKIISSNTISRIINYNTNTHEVVFKIMWNNSECIVSKQYLFIELTTLAYHI